MRPAPLLLAALVVAGCSPHPAPKAAPTVTVTAPPSPAALSQTDTSDAHLACFGWTTYDRGKKMGDADTAKYATTAQQPTGRMSDPRWSHVAGLPPEEAMTVLGGLCKEIHYHE